MTQPPPQDARYANRPDIPLEAVVHTEELRRRPSRPPNYSLENRTIARLLQVLADSAETVLQTLVESALEVGSAGSAGISLLLDQDNRSNFHWPAIAGFWKPFIGGCNPRHFSPCGDVLDCNRPLLFHDVEK